jgi:fission process protein 1
MWWGKSSDKPAEPSKEAVPQVQKVVENVEKKIEKTAKEFDPNELPPREKLPAKLQKIMDKADKEDSFYDELVEG